VSLKTAAESFPDGGKEGFKKWLKGKCTVPLRKRTMSRITSGSMIFGGSFKGHLVQLHRSSFL
jgi:hypothetical protein